jgi:polar amino acid transport system permease protein
MEFDFSPVIEAWRYLLTGLELTLLLSAGSVVGGLLFGTILGIARNYGPAWLRVALVFYIDSMRAVPVLVLLVWTYFAGPLVFGVTIPAFWAALIAIIAQTSAFVAEILRAGLTSVRAGQSRAGLALGLSEAQVVRHIVLPQALVRMLPAFASIIAITIKDTAIAGVIAVPEFLFRSQTLASQSFRPIEVFLVAITIYFILIYPVTRGMNMAYARLAHRGRS